MLHVLKNILDSMDANIYVSDLETDETMFVNKRMNDFIKKPIEAPVLPAKIDQHFKAADA